MKMRVTGMILILVLAHWAVGAAAQTPAAENAKACACCQNASATGTAGVTHDHAAKACCQNHEKGCADCCASKDGKMDCCKSGAADCCKSAGCCGSKDGKMCAAKDGKDCCAGGQCDQKPAAK